MKRSLVLLTVVIAISSFAFAQEPSVSLAGGYRLWPGDVIEIKFFFNQELNDTMQIRPDGLIAMPLIGEVPVSNRTVSDVCKRLEQLYAQHLKHPSITIFVRSYSSQKVFVSGEVPKPGVINLAGPLTMLEAIMEAGGIKHTGNTGTAYLIRKRDDGVPVMREISLKNSRNEPAPAAGLLLFPLDVVVVPESKIARVDRWVDQHIRQVTPMMLTFGFSYLFNGGVVR
jgi:polysaccharide export outer membrane protein